jgi:hypothetical protein
MADVFIADPITPKYWDVQNIPSDLVRELRRRKNSNNIGLDIPDNVIHNFKNQHASYKGPMTPWIRVFSNSTGIPLTGRVPLSSYLKKNGEHLFYEGFVLEGGKGFNNAYGLSDGGRHESVFDSSSSKAIIGYQSNGEPHYIDNRYRSNIYSTSSPAGSNFPQNNTIPSVLPPPGITSLSVKTTGDMMTSAEFKFSCFSLGQVEYMTPFFLSPGINMFIEFGWNLYNNDSLLDLNKIRELYDISNVPAKGIERILSSYGNYGVVTGIVTNYNFGTKDGMHYECNVKVTDRQALFAGFRADLDARKSDDVGDSEINFLNIKKFFNSHVTEARTAVVDRKNFTDHMLNLTDASQVGSKSNTSKFYNGKNEDRIFFGRLTDMGKDVTFPASITFEGESLENHCRYGTVSGGFGNFGLYSDIDTTCDFDNDGKSPEDWYTLGFVFELINIHCADPTTKTFHLDIEDVVINAHPNLISCDRDVLIPNSIAPKINVGRPEPGGFLPDTSTSDNNKFIHQEVDNVMDSNLKTPLKKVSRVFKTPKSQDRQNLDQIINWVRYSYAGNLLVDCAFPFKEDLLVPITGKGGESMNRIYPAHRYGHLKNLFISKTKLIDIGNDENIKTLKQLVNAILITVNLSVNNYWEFEVINNAEGGLTVIDKSMNALDELYQFEIGTTNNVIRDLEFDVKLSPEQATQTLFGTGNNRPSVELYEKQGEEVAGIRNEIDGNSFAENMNSAELVQFTLGQKSLPSIAFADRFALLTVQDDLSKLQGGILERGITEKNNRLIENRNSVVKTVQTYGKIPGCLIMTMAIAEESTTSVVDEEQREQETTVATNRLLGSRRIIEKKYKPTERPFLLSRVSDAEKEASRQDELNKQSDLVEAETKFKKEIARINKKYKPKDVTTATRSDTSSNIYYMLNFPSYLKDKFSEILDDGDFDNNSGMYSNVADNFLISFKLDGMYGFRMFQHFSINNLPKPYVPGNCIFMIKEIDHQISNGNWETSIVAMLKGTRPNKITYTTI